MTGPWVTERVDRINDTRVSWDVAESKTRVAVRDANDKEILPGGPA